MYREILGVDMIDKWLERGHIIPTVSKNETAIPGGGGDSHN